MNKIKVEKSMGELKYYCKRFRCQKLLKRKGWILDGIIYWFRSVLLKKINIYIGWKYIIN